MKEKNETTLEEENQPPISNEEVVAVTAQLISAEDNGDKPATTQKQIHNFSYRITVMTTRGMICVIVSTPTAFLNFLGSLSITLNLIHNVSSLKELIVKHSVGEIVNAGWNGVCSEVLNTAINIVYLGPAVKKVGNMLIKAFNAFRKKCGKKAKDNENLSVIEIVSFLWAFGTSLPFAQIAKDAFNFIDNWSYIPFGLNGLYYFATRYDGVEGVLKRAFDKYEKFKKEIIKDITSVEDKRNLRIPVDMRERDIHKRLDSALQAYLSRFYDDKIDSFQNSQYFKLNSLRDKWLNYIAMVVGVPVATALALCMWPLVAQKNIEGFESLTGLTIGRKAQYKNAWSLGFGYPISAPSPFFYAKALAEFPYEIIKFGRGLYACYKNNKYVQLIGWAGLAVLLAYMAYVSRKGWENVAQTIIEEGYLDYLGITAENGIGKIFPKFIATTAASLNASVSLKLFNRAMEPQEKFLNEITEVDHKMALWLLEYSSPDLSELKKHNYFILLNKSVNSEFFTTLYQGLRKRKVKKESDEQELLVINPMENSLHL